MCLANWRRTLLYLNRNHVKLQSRHVLVGGVVISCLTLLGPAAAKRQPSEAPATRSVVACLMLIMI